MKRNLVIFGSNEIAELSHYYFTKDSDFKLQAFSLDGDFIKESTFLGLPVVPFEEITSHFPPQDNSIFIALSYSKVNAEHCLYFLHSN